MPQISPHSNSRRPRLHEMERIDTKSLRSNVKIKDEKAYIHTTSGPLEVKLIWLERTGGTFGPGSAAFATLLRQSIKSRLDASKLVCLGDPHDRGLRKAWILYFSCPRCSRRCRVLYGRKGTSEFGCVKCNRPAYPSNCWPYTGRLNARGISHLERTRLKHEQAAMRLKEKLLTSLMTQKTKGGLNTMGEANEEHILAERERNELIYRLNIKTKEALVALLRVAHYHLGEEARRQRPMDSSRSRKGQ